MSKKTREEVTKDIMDVEFEDTSKAKYIDDDGYEEGKSKTRELIEEALKEGDPKDFMFKRGMKMLMEK
jgi:hypothetical protein